MNFYVMTKTYDSYGAHTTLSEIGDFLLRDAPRFGDAIREIVVTLYFRDAGPPRATLEQLFDTHQRYRETLPRIVFRRAKAKVEIDLASELMEGSECRPSPHASLSLFARGLDEVVTALALLRKRLKSSDAFDLQAFLAHCETARKRLPGSQDEFQALADQQDATRQAAWAAMSPWERLDIDWDEFHPEARKLLDDPFFWDRVDELSPNGNDTGADLLESYRASSNKSRGNPVRFLQRLAEEWGYAGLDAMDDEVRDEAAVGLAFADIKLRGICDEGACSLALAAIERQRLRTQTWSDVVLRDQRLRALDKVEGKLRQLAS